ncbi:MAG TPA: heparinase II/III family protein [Thermomicrobiales bacterium]|nr:heparinase II/III family protein [Thermomicrobiales bacterium]
MRLAELFPLDTVKSTLTVPEGWSSFPPVENRSAWKSLPPEQRQSLIAAAEEHLGKPWESLPATLFMEFYRNGNRMRYEVVSFGRRMQLQSLILGECVENQGRFTDDIVNGIWAICEESFWDVTAHNHRTGGPFPLPDPSEPIVALFSAETGSTLAWAVHLVRTQLDAIDPIVARRVDQEIRDRLLDPFMARDNWRWLGFEQGDRPGPPNNWNPWIISNLLTMTMLIEPDPDRRLAIVEKCLRGLDKFIAGYHPDGGCDEGISYWGRAGASLFECLDVLDRASDGALAIWDQPLVAEMARYVPRAHIGGQWYVNFADATAIAAPDANVVYQFGERIGDPGVMAQAVASLRDTKPPSRPRLPSFNRTLNDLFRPIPQPANGVAYPLPLQSWLPGIQVLTARETEGDDGGLFLAAKGGTNGESHNHNDIGSFIVALDGVPVLIDAGVGEYTKQTFSNRRYELWPMVSPYHNLPTVNGHQQQPGVEFAARDVSATLDADSAELRLDIAGAWGEDAGITSWDRVVRLERGDNAAVVVEDAWALREPPTSLALSLMTWKAPDVSNPNRLVVNSGGRELVVDLEPGRWSASVERIPIDDSRMTPVWGDAIHRITLTLRQPVATGSWTLRIHA